MYIYICVCVCVYIYRLGFLAAQKKDFESIIAACWQQVRSELTPH